MKLSERNILLRLAVWLVAALCTGLTVSCHAIYDDLDPCPRGASLRFVYDYNMEFANAFPSQVDCLTLLVYDENGVFVDSFTETSEVLANEDWRMILPLEPGKYRFVAWGGITDEKASFHFTQNPAAVAMQDMQVAMNADCMTSPVGTRLHSLFYGELMMEIPEESTDYIQDTVYMMKDTNNIRILLENLNGKPSDGADFIFTITDDNTLLSYDNKLVADNQYIYYPWTSGQVSAGTLDDGSEALLAFAELSTSRLVAGNNARLVIQRRDDLRTIVDIPLINFLLLLKSQEFAEMGRQEFLDRESRWNMVFFLDSSDCWINTYIKINDWIVRINNTEF
ncbi:MAG: FimB/Mfa2 family fimbrial subunit [Muribaculaceae bacterium]|nr:FimB/Mfa2 family fimbrial subunit [Muribaculaceae bacterium]